MQKIGVYMCGFAIGILFLMIISLFDKVLLAFVNITFIIGSGFAIGCARCYDFFFQHHRIRGTAFFFSGMLVVLIGWPVVGITFELYGLYSLFAQFWLELYHEGPAW